MKKTILILSLLVSAFSAEAATLTASNLSNGITGSDLTTALASGRLRFGRFDISDVLIQANANDVSYLDSHFASVVDYSGAISVSSTPGFFSNATIGAGTYAGGATTYGPLTYDGSPGSTTDVGGDIAGSGIYLWVLDNATLGSATQHGIFASTQIWKDSDLVGVAANSSFSMAAASLTALVGGEANGADIGAGASSHSLANIAAVPEPSRAVLAFAGLATMFFRRRRA